jgi:cation transport ATPase
VEAVGEGTALAGIRRLVEQAQASGSRAQALADRAAGLLFWFALGAGLVTAVVWLALGEPDQAVERTVTVLVIACPHALGLAIPLVIAISTGLAARNGILVKDRLALERMRTVDAVLFDKTGTLTKGEPQVTGVATTDGGDDGELLRLGRRVVLLTGDAGQVAEAVAAELGVDEVVAEVLPQDKAQAVADLQRRGLKVAMVGDGSMMPRPWPGPMSASPLGPAPMWPSSRPGSCSPPTTPAGSSG